MKIGLIFVFMSTVGIIGCGSVAMNNYSWLFRRHFTSDRIFCSDINVTQANEFAKKTGGRFLPLTDLIAASDIIVIASPPDSHFELLCSSISREKKILCEKPFLLSLSEALHVKDTATTLDARVYVGHVRRFFPAIGMARNFMEMGVAGQVLKAELFEGSRFGYASTSGYIEKSPLGGVVTDTGSHTLDTLFHVLGWDKENIEIDIATVERNKPEPSHVFRASFSVRFSGGNTEVFLSLSRRSQLANKINIYCENGILEIPVTLNNAVKYSTKKGSFVLREANPVDSVLGACDRQFSHIMYEDGQLVTSERFMNLTNLLEQLLNYPS